MRHNFILLATLVILSMVEPSHNAISFPRITFSDLSRPYYNATDILEVSSHDVIPRSCAPAELTRGVLHYEATAISENPQNMCFAGGATTKSSVDIASVASLVLDKLIRFTLHMVLIGFVALLYKAMHVVNQWHMWELELAMNNDGGWSVSTNSTDFKKVSTSAEMLLTRHGRICYRRVSSDKSLDLYLLKEAFEELERHPEIVGNPGVYDFASRYMLETVNRATFMKIPNDRRVDWLLTRHFHEAILGWRWPEYERKWLTQ